MMLRGFRLPLLSAIALVLALVSITRTAPRREPADPPATPPASPFTSTIAAAGLIEPSSENVAIGTHLTGVVERVAVVAGARIGRGDLLFSLDARHLDAEVAAREARLKEAQRQVETDRVEAQDAASHLEFAESAGPAAIARQELVKRRFAADAATARLEETEAHVDVMQAALAQALVERERSEVRAPIDGTVLKVDVRSGEPVLAGASVRPLVLLGETVPLHVRVDVDEHDAWRVSAAAPARASLRGQTAIASDLTFVRFEPYVMPKRSLTGDSTERVDTRVLQVIYRIDQPDARWFVGEQVDVFIEGASEARG